MEEVIIIQIWLAVLIIFIVVEAITPNLVTIWFIPAALAGLVAHLLGAQVWLQAVVFIVVGLVFLVTTKPLFEKLFSKRPIEVTNAQALIGKRAVAVEEIDNMHETGAVRVEGKIWTARNYRSSDVIPVGAIVEINAIEGVKLMCSQIKE